jgi:hypothetical protein
MLSVAHTFPVATLNKGSNVLTYHCEIDLALTYALRRPRLALECAFHALRMAVAMRRPDLAVRANDLIGALV